MPMPASRTPRPAPAQPERVRFPGENPEPRMPPMLAGAAALSWRLLVVAVVFLGLVLFLNRITTVVIPVFAAVLVSAMLHRPVGFLRRHGWPRSAASGLVLVLTLLLLAGVGYLVVTRVVGEYSQLVAQVADVRRHLRTLVESVAGTQHGQVVDQLTGRLLTWLQQHRTAVAGGVLTVGWFAVELLTGAIIAVFLTFFFLADGDRMWAWLMHLLPAGVRPSVNGAGHRAWRVLSSWVLGTAAIALFHSVVIGVSLWLLGAPLVLPMAALIFLGSFLPIIGAVLFGGVAVLVTLATVGVVPALVLLAVLLVDDQIEAHLLQPFIVGRAVRLHPVAIVLVLAGGGALAGVVGAIVAVPLVASLHAAIKFLTGVEDIDGDALAATDRREPMPPPRAAPLPLLSRNSDAAASNASQAPGSRLRT